MRGGILHEDSDKVILPYPYASHYELMVTIKWRNKKEWKDTRERVLKRDKGCIVCNKQGLLHAHHLIPMGFKIFDIYRADITNIVMLCPMHHTFGKWSAHKNPFWFRQWMMDNRKGTLELAEDRINDLWVEEKNRIT